MRAIAILAVAVLLLAGCAGSTKTTSTSHSGTSTTATSSTTSKSGTTGGTSTSGTTTTAPTAQGTNHAPAATITASSPGGALPLNVTFTLKGSDSDGDELTYTFDADSTNPVEKSGKGTEFPVTFVFQYKTAGNFTAVLSVSDGKNVTKATQSVKVAAGGVAATKQTFASSFSVDNPACYGAPYDSLPNDDPSGNAEHLSYADMPVAPGTIGQPFHANFASGAGDDHVLFLDATGAKISSFGTGLQSDLNWDIVDVVPAGAATAIFYGCENLAGEGFTYTAGPGTK